MSLSKDFNNYYGDCYVGFRPEGDDQTRAFYVTTVKVGSGYSENDYTEEAVNALRFSGYFLVDGKSTGVENVTLSSGKLELEMPELGYVNLEEGNKCLTFKPQRSVRKGLCRRRIEGCQGYSDAALAEAIYKSVHKTPSALSRQFAIEGGDLMYKENKIGFITDDVYKILLPYRYLRCFINKVFGENINIQIVEG